MNFLRPELLQHAHNLLRGGAAHDRVVDEHDALPGHNLPDRIQLHLHAEVADGLLRLDERPPDVVIADQSELERNAGFLRVAERGEEAGIGDGNDDIRVHWMLARKLCSEALPGLSDVGAEDDGVGPREVDVLEDAPRLALRGELMDHAKCGGGGGATLHHHDLAGTNLADGIRFDQIEGAGLGGDDERVGETPQDERTKPVGIARGVDAAGGEHGD